MYVSSQYDPLVSASTATYVMKTGRQYRAKSVRPHLRLGIVSTARSIVSGYIALANRVFEGCGYEAQLQVL